MANPDVQSLFDLSGKVALISGASGYLGSAMSSALAEAGATVIVTSRDGDRAAAAAAALPQLGNASHHALVMDQHDPQSIEHVVTQSAEITDGIDILINNGQFGPGNDWTDITTDQFNTQLHNASGYFTLARLVRNQAVERSQSASIVMIGSMYGQVASYPEAYEGVCNASPVSYHALKGWIIHMTRHLAVYWAQDSVRVNCLSPGAFPNPEGVPEGLVERLIPRCPMKRMGLPHELKGAVVFLASNASSYMTGQNLTIDGGWTAW